MAFIKEDSFDAYLRTKQASLTAGITCCLVYEELFKVFICLHQNAIYAIQRRGFSLRYRRVL